MAVRVARKRKTAPGIYRRESGSGQVSWQVKIRTKGFPAFNQSYATYRDAEQALAELRLRQARGVRCDPRRADAVTLGDVIEARMQALKDGRRKVKGVQPELYRFERFLREETALCAYAMANLTHHHFTDWLHERLEEVSPGTAKRELTLLRPVLREACRNLGLPGSPLDLVENPRVQDERIARFQPGEEHRLMKELQTCVNPYVLPAAIFALETAVRRGELLRLEWKFYDPCRGLVFLPDAKNGSSRSVPLTRKAQGIVDSLPRRASLIFDVPMETLKQAFERARDRVGMHHWRWHDFRHEAISRLFDQGMPLEQVKDVSGHRDIKSLLRYRHVREDDTVSRLRRLEDEREHLAAERLKQLINHR